MLHDSLQHNQWNRIETLIKLFHPSSYFVGQNFLHNLCKIGVENLNLISTNISAFFKYNASNVQT